MLIDTHSHIHFDEYKETVPEVLANAQKTNLSHIFCVGVDEVDSVKAREFIKNWQPKTPIQLLATAGLHPHEAKKGLSALKKVAKIAHEAKQNGEKVVAIGECGLDYFKEYSPKIDQIKAFRYQIELALELRLPLIWHVRDAFDDFFKIIDEYPAAKGVVHSFTDTKEVALQIVERNFAIGLNGIMTFTKNSLQLEAANCIPLSNLVLETDCPFLTPEPKRGTINEPANLELIAKFLAKLRNESLTKFRAQTTANVRKLFNV